MLEISNSQAVGSAETAGRDRAFGRGIRVFGLPCTDTFLDAAARHLVRSADEGVPRRVVFVNAHSLNVSVHDAALQKALRSADVIYADGVGMAIAARLQGQRLKHNVNGTDLFPHLCKYAAASGTPMALLGGEPGVAEACERVIESDYPGLKVVWSHHGFVRRANDSRLLDQINASGARILLVAMGAPLQERWIMEHWHRLTVPVVMGVGGLFDFVSGSVPRAPKAFRTLRLEWLFRLMIEPRRLFVRYVLGNPLFLVRALKYAWTGSVWPASKHRVIPR